MNEKDALETRGAIAASSRRGSDDGTTHLTQEAVARRFDLSVATLERWRSVGIGPVYLKLGGKIRYRLQDIEMYERDCLHQSTSERVAAAK